MNVAAIICVLTACCFSGCAGWTGTFYPGICQDDTAISIGIGLREGLEMNAAFWELTESRKGHVQAFATENGRRQFYHATWYPGSEFGKRGHYLIPANADRIEMPDRILTGPEYLEMYQANVLRGKQYAGNRR